MTNEPRQSDEGLLIDFHLGACEQGEAEAVRRRLAEDAGFARLSEDVAATLSAVGLAPEAEPPADLVAKTVARVASARRTEALLAKEGAARGWRLPTFSLRELGVAAAAVILLGVIFIPSLRQARRRGLEVQCASNVGQIGAALQNYASSNNEYLPVAGAAAGDGRWLPADGRPATSNSAGLFKLVTLSHARSPRVFQCPAVGAKPMTVQAGMVDFPAADFIHYSYQHALGSRGLWRSDRTLQAVQSTMAILADSSPLFSRGSAGGRGRRRVDRPTTSVNHAHAGQNVLRLDMSVSWVTNADVGVGGDNIYLAGNVLEYQGTETPVGPTDSFLLPAYAPR